MKLFKVVFINIIQISIQLYKIKGLKEILKKKKKKEKRNRFNRLNQLGEKANKIHLYSFNIILKIKIY